MNLSAECILQASLNNAVVKIAMGACLQVLDFTPEMRLLLVQFASRRRLRAGDELHRRVPRSRDGYWRSIKDIIVRESEALTGLPTSPDLRWGQASDYPNAYQEEPVRRAKLGKH